MEVQALCGMCCLRCTLDSQMELSAGREIYESGHTMQTQKVIFIVLIQCGNANHPEKSQLITGGRRSLFHTQRLRVRGAGTLPHTRVSYQDTSGPTLALGRSEQQAQAASSLPSSAGCLPCWPRPRPVTTLFFPLLTSGPLSQI